MAKPKKKVTNQNINLGEDLRNSFNSDEWHQLFDILATYEQEGGSPDDKVGRLIQRYIEKEFSSHSFPWKTEADFVLKKMSALAGSWIFGGKPLSVTNKAGKPTSVILKGLLNREDFEDVVSNAFTKLMVSGNYDPTATQAEKFSYIHKVTCSAALDLVRPMKNFKVQLEPNPEVPSKKKVA